jgi:hypothetical protein
VCSLSTSEWSYTQQIDGFAHAGKWNGRLARRCQKCTEIALVFLKHATKFLIPQPEYYAFDYTINVNLLAIQGRDFYKTFQLIQEKLVEEG